MEVTASVVLPNGKKAVAADATHAAALVPPVLTNKSPVDAHTRIVSINYLYLDCPFSLLQRDCVFSCRYDADLPLPPLQLRLGLLLLLQCRLDLQLGWVDGVSMFRGFGPWRFATGRFFGVLILACVLFLHIL